MRGSVVTDEQLNALVSEGVLPITCNVGEISEVLRALESYQCKRIKLETLNAVSGCVWAFTALFIMIFTKDFIPAAIIGAVIIGPVWAGVFYYLVMNGLLTKDILNDGMATLLPFFEYMAKEHDDNQEVDIKLCLTTIPETAEYAIGKDFRRPMGWFCTSGQTDQASFQRDTLSCAFSNGRLGDFNINMKEYMNRQGRTVRSGRDYRWEFTFSRNLIYEMFKEVNNPDKKKFDEFVRDKVMPGRFFLRTNRSGKSLIGVKFETTLADKEPANPATLIETFEEFVELVKHMQNDA
jgi:hypothetical protein